MSELLEYGGKELIEKLNSGELSVLEALGAHELKEEMAPVGLLCRLLAGWICLAKEGKDVRKRAVSTLKLLTPAKEAGEFPQTKESLVIGFNHPSLGEIFRLLQLGFQAYPDKEFLFPVNIPWYEAMTPIIPRLSRMGVHITPMITPSTENKLQLMFRGDEEKLRQIQHIKVAFERTYMREAREAAGKSWAIFVAPSATRQAKVIGDHIHPTMTLLAHMVYRKPDTGTLFLPVAVVEPKNSSRRVNLFRKYIISPCQPFERTEVEAVTDNSREFDLMFLTRIDDRRKQLKK